MNSPGLPLLAIVLPLLSGCESSGVIVGNEGVGAMGETGNVRAAVGPDDAAFGYSGDRVVAAADSDEGVVGVRVDDRSPLVIGGGTEEGGRPFGGIGMGF